MVLLPSLFLGLAFATVPSDLDGLVGLALERDPEVRALESDAARAQSQATGASRLMDPKLMVGLQAIGSMDPAEPPMGMVGATQMFRGWGEGRARSVRLELDGLRSGVDRDRVAVDLRTRLWQSAARIGTFQETLALLDDQLRSANGLRELAFARYAAGADVGTGMAPMGGPGGSAMGGMGSGGPMEMGVAPPVVVPRGGGGSGMGMGMGGGAPQSTGPAVPGFQAPGAAPSAPIAPVSTGGLATLLRLDAELAGVVAEREALAARLDGERRVLALFVGAEAEEAVAATPAAFLGTAGAGVPEQRLAELDREAAEADVTVARTARRPDLMVSVAERIMLMEGMLGGTDVGVGFDLPLWGGRGREIDAAEAGVAAAKAREDLVARELSVASEQARAALTAAAARSSALDGVALPRARAAWDATLALFAAGQARQDDAVRAWETWLDLGRQAKDARLDVQLRAAELARVEGP
jgi:outer membrane protein TolC